MTECTAAEAQQAMDLIRAARVAAIQKVPYLARPLFAMPPVRADGIGTVASDDQWRLYYDPLAVIGWTVEEVAGALIHEVSHCVRGHAAWFKKSNTPAKWSKAYNVAGDALINDDIRDSGMALPAQAIYMNTLIAKGYKVNRSMSSQQVFEVLRGAGDDPQDQSGQGAGGAGDDQQKQGQGAGESGQAGSLPESWGDCGSAADGVRRDYEQAGDGTPGVTEDRADLLRRETAKAIKEHSRLHGNMPGNWERWAEALLEPVVDWRRELASIVRSAFALVAGQRDYSYQRPSRRQSSMVASGQGVILPAMRQPAPPQGAIVIDTSGSVSEEELTWCLTEVKGVLRSVGSGSNSLSIITCDTRASAQKVRRVEDLRLNGGGGTDMRIGIKAALDSKPKPAFIIVLTDGYTPWPKEPLKDCTLIVALTQEDARSSVPVWARTVIINPNEQKG